MNEKILVVDDETEIADLIQVYLNNDGYTVYKFYNGVDALKCIEETDKIAYNKKTGCQNVECLQEKEGKA